MAKRLITMRYNYDQYQIRVSVNYSVYWDLFMYTIRIYTYAYIIKIIMI